MVVKLIFISLYAILVFFLAKELNKAKLWHKMVYYPYQEYAMSDSEFEEWYRKRKDEIKKNSLIEWWISEPFKDLRKARNAGFIKVPCHFRFGFREDVSQVSLWTQGKLLSVDAYGPMWKDKYDTPRYEMPPYIEITFFMAFTFRWVWSFNYDFGTPIEDRYDPDQYWEQALWTIYYCGNDLDKARKTWPWQRRKDGVDVSTWDEKYIKKNLRNN